MVLMIAPPQKKEAPEIDLQELLRFELRQYPLKTAVKNLVERYGLNKNEVYQTALRVKDE